jgi:ATP-binding cassette subfamily B protein
MQYLSTSTRAELALHLMLIFAAAAVLAGFVRATLIYVSTKVNAAIAHDITLEIFRRSIYQPYEVHLGRNSSTLIASLQRCDEIAGLLGNLSNAVSALIVGAFVTTTIFVLEPRVAATILAGVGGTYVAVSWFTRKKIAASGIIANQSYGTRIKYLQEAIGGMRDVLLGHTQGIFIKEFGAQDRRLRGAATNIQILAPLPRIVVEAVGMIALASLGYWFMATEGGVGQALPVLGGLALGIQRLLPMAQQVYQGLVQLRGTHHSVLEVLNLLQQPLPQPSPLVERALPFVDRIQFRNVSYRYSDKASPVLSDLSLIISKGARVGIIGPTGSGKSTAADILMGLLKPTSGDVLVDGVPLRDDVRIAWQKNIAHVPQSIFLADSSFLENIAFGVPKDSIDVGRVEAAATQAQLSDFIDRQPNRYHTKVGERGVRLSGGQRQRIGIARALYQQATVLVFDEATSALDHDTEDAVMHSISTLAPDLTIVLIAHRLRTLEGCDVVYHLKAGRLINSGSFTEVVGGQGARFEDHSEQRPLALMGRYNS